VNIDEKDYPMHIHVVAGELMKDELSGGKITFKARETVEEIRR